MLNQSQRVMVQTYGTTLGRMLMGLLFAFSGVGTFLGGVESTAGYFASVGIPMSALVVWLVIILKIGAGGALILGYRVGLAAIALILFTLVATAIAHLSFEDQNLFKNLAIVGGLLYVLAYGAGEGWSVGKSK